MSFDAVAFQVFIASPSDVEKERHIIREILYEWNAINSVTKKIVLLPIGWDSHATPTMGEPPQRIINKTVLKNADLLVGVFWTRIGTPTDDFPSGTVEEIEEHIKSGKPTMLYFSEAPVPPDKLIAEQYNRVKEFRESCNRNRRGIYQLYKNPDDFRATFNRQLQIKLNSDDCFKSALDNSDSITQKNSQIELSEEAKAILLEASKSLDGSIFRTRTSVGLQINVGKKQFIENYSPRTLAIWESAIKELEASLLINAKGHKREIFGMTRKGYDLAEKLLKTQ